MKNLRLQKMTAVAVAAAMGLILQLIAFPILPMFPFLKLDFSDIPVLINMFIFGPLTGIATAFIRSLLHLTMTGFSIDNLIGDFASFFASTLYTLPIFLMFRKRTTSKRILGLGLGILAMTIYEYCKLLCDYAALFEGIWTFSRTNARNGIRTLYFSRDCSIQYS